LTEAKIAPGGHVSGSPRELSAEAAGLSEYIAGALGQDLPPLVVTKTKQHILDTLAAIISGSRLRAGRLAAAYVERIGGVQEATVFGTSLLVPAANAALANGMAAHADETDDSHLGGRFHPGSGIIPAALAVAEQRGLGGSDLVRAVALG
jgi:2-methylcitrate dehydratase PrpD